MKASSEIKIKNTALDGSRPNGRSWRKFLLKECEERERSCGCVYFGTTNCNYIVFPSGDIAQNYGYHGRAMMASIRELGWEVVLADIKHRRAQTIRLLLAAGADKPSGHRDLKTFRLVRVIVLCRNFNGQVDAYYCKINISKTDMDEGLHYAVAEVEAAKKGFSDPMLSVDEEDNMFERLGAGVDWDAV